MKKVTFFDYLEVPFKIFLKTRFYLEYFFNSIFHRKKRGHFEVPFWIYQKGTD